MGRARGCHAAHAAHPLPTPPIRSPLPAPRAGLTLSFPATGTFGQLPQLLTILGGGVCGFLEPSFVWLLNHEGGGVVSISPLPRGTVTVI